MNFGNYLFKKIKRTYGREGEGFIGTLVLVENGKETLVAEVSNYGDGGCSFARFANDAAEQALMALIDKHPPETLDGMPLSVTLDLWLSTLAEEVLFFGKARRARKTKTYVQSKIQFPRYEWTVFSRPWRIPAENEFQHAFVLNPDDLNGYLNRFPEERKLLNVA